ncbi:hypothetical protein RHA1_ro01691 [Rhodococcus jostii RHA1]|uniref:Uncharacterized protein n=1 Tax=Rhodococcus jostii (strain RHA1) TaxID=101510 RepID=Q0SG32_RHOJR|nr:hypothetical protein RHA1_ro01691 [Rhodococcus jostii RHA1]
MKLIPDCPGFHTIPQRVANQCMDVTQSPARQRIRVNTLFDRHPRIGTSADLSVPHDKMSPSPRTPTFAEPSSPRDAPGKTL